ncbi:response regulator transcription factor [uncultured Fibrella sp.]|uniref:helix-turn-helix transcriptional regulator n=1 Tax=uncultured Fibrella sp. TaxID=1284596 RepID=UPI0035CA00AE
MLKIDLSHRLHQNLLSHFLINRNYTISDCDSTPGDQTVVILITDKIPGTNRLLSKMPQVWLLDGQQHLSLPIPTQVKGLLLSDCELPELELCLRQLLNQQTYVSPKLLHLLTEERPKPAIDTACSQLTNRQKQVFELIKAGLSVRDIAEKLFISPHTAENHRANIQRKMELSGRLSLVRYAASAKLH